MENDQAKEGLLERNKRLDELRYLLDRQDQANELLPKIDFDSQPPITINPSQDTFDGKLFFGQKLPVTIQNETTDQIVLISSERKPYYPQGVFCPFEISHIPQNSNRWTHQSIKDFIEGNVSVEPNTLFSNLTNAFKEYVDLGDERVYSLTSAFVIGSYMFSAFDAFPYLSLHGTKKAGKTKTLSLFWLLGFNARMDLSITEATIFRAVYEQRPLYCLDEFDFISDEAKKIVTQLLRAGYKKMGGTVPRIEKTKIGKKETFVLKDLPVYSPKVFSGTWELSDFSERCIRITMLRTLKSEIARKHPRAEDPKWSNLRDSLYCFALQNFDEIKKIYDSIENEANFDGRSWELWKPLLSIGKFISETIYADLLALAKDLEIKRQTEDKGKDENLILTTLLKFEPSRLHQLFIDELRVQLTENYPDDFDPDIKQKRSINSKIGRTLARLGIQTRRLNKGMVFEITLTKLRELCDRYGVKADQDSQDTQGTQPTLANYDSQDTLDSPHSLATQHTQDSLDTPLVNHVNQVNLTGGQ